MVFKKSILSGFVILLLPILITGCVIAPIHYNWWEYEPVDSINIRKNDVEYVYIPRVRPPRFYSYNKFWYAEPYTILGRQLRPLTLGHILLLNRLKVCPVQDHDDLFK